MSSFERGEIVMNNHESESKRWFLQGRRDRQVAEVNRREQFYEWVCFLSQQAAEKLLKAYLYFHGESDVRGHSTHILAERCAEYHADFNTVLDDCQKLDLFYIPTRYPNGLPGQIPYEAFGESIALEALSALDKVFEVINNHLPFDSE
jgi:HEPN domain-containing protein